MLLLSILAHQSEAGHPDLLAWIKHQLDSVIGLGPATVVILLGLVMASIPAVILLLYIIQRRRGGLPQR
jgi:hypothetical protein